MPFVVDAIEKDTIMQFVAYNLSSLPTAAAISLYGMLDQGTCESSLYPVTIL